MDRKSSSELHAAARKHHHLADLAASDENQRSLKRRWTATELADGAAVRKAKEEGGDKVDRLAAYHARAHRELSRDTDHITASLPRRHPLSRHHFRMLGHHDEMHRELTGKGLER